MSEPPEPAAEPSLAKSTVTHKLAFAGKNPELALLHGCVLSGFSPDYHKSDIVRTRALQHSLRCHYYNLITANPEQRYALPYSLNCPPPAFKVTPKTRCCTNVRTCPWCHIRRQLMPIYEAIMAVPEEIRRDCKVVGWARGFPFVPGHLPFFAPKKSPHQWCQALVTAQLVAPTFHPRVNQLCLHHAGIQLIPKSCDPIKALGNPAVMPVLGVCAFDNADSETVLEAISMVVRLPWVTLSRKENLTHFQTLMDGFHKQQLLRINRYKGISHGHQQPTVPKAELQPAESVSESL